MVSRFAVSLLALACTAAQAESARVFVDSQFSEDSDAQRMSSAAFGFQQTLPKPGGDGLWALRAGHRRLEAPAGSEDFNSLRADWEMGRKSALGGGLRLNLLDSPDWSPVLGAASLHWNPAANWYVESSFEREWVDTVVAVRNHTLLDTSALSVDWTFVPEFTVVAAGNYSDFTDGNDRKGRAFRLIWSPKSLSGFNLQLRTRRSDNDAVGVGYFNPRRLEEAELIARIAGSPWSEQWVLSAQLNGGRQRVNSDVENPIYAADLRARGWFTQHYGLEAQALCANTGTLASATGAEGYRYCQGTLTAIYAW